MPSNQVTISAKITRSTKAAITPMKITFLRCSGGQSSGERADHDRIITRENDIDHQHLQERCESRG